VRSTIEHPRRPHRRLGIAARVRRVAPVTIGLGTTMAFERERRRGSVPVAPALLAAVVGVLGVVGTIQIDQGLDDALDHPERAGVTWDATVVPLEPEYTEAGLKSTFTELVRAAPAVVDTAVVDRALIDVNGTGIPAFSVQPSGGVAGTSISLAVTKGRAPSAPGEAAIGPHTAEQLDVGVGDTVALGDGDREARIVGEALFPSDVHSEFDEGLWLAQPDLLAALPGSESGDVVSGVERAVAVVFRPGVEAEAATAELAEVVGGRAADVTIAEVPPELTNLRNVRTLPVVLAALLAVLAVAALSLLTPVRLRRPEELKPAA
jgi:hypothetical protein